jgi:SAM-dependent methyltransferase
MSIPQEEILRLGFRLPAASVDTWRIYDERDPIPGYFQFDWLSSRHPDLYHKFALSTVGLMEKLHTLYDLTGCEVVDIGAGTGRSASGAVQQAKMVYAVDAYQSVVTFGKNQLAQANITNVHYVNGNRDHLPFQESSLDAAINAWAELNLQEAYRVLKPDGVLIQLGAPLNALCGELTSLLAPDYPWIPTEVAPAKVYQPDYPDTVTTADNSIWDGLPITGAIHIHQFTYTADYGDYAEAAAITGRLYGPKAKRYFLTRKQSTISWRLQIIIGQVKK